jgi:hypothetical protein
MYVESETHRTLDKEIEGAGRDRFSGPDSPNYVVCKITPYRIEYQKMVMMTPEIWEKWTHRQNNGY